MSENPKAFVIMPFDAEFTPIYEQLIKPALEAVGYDVHRADSFFDQENILRDIVRGISEASLVVAELTIPNPNVYYELGLCHALKIPAILIAQSMDEIPFDLRSYRIQIYSTHFDQVGKLQQSLKEIGERHKIGDIKFGSPVIDFLSTDYVKNLPKAVAVVSDGGTIGVEEASKESLIEEGGFLDFILEGTASGEKMTGIMNAIAAATTDIGGKMVEHTENIKSISVSPGYGAAAQAQKIATLVARDIDKYSDIVEGLLPELESSIEQLVENYTGYTKWLPLNSEENVKQTLNWRSQIDGLRNAATTGLTGIVSFRDSMKQLISIGVSREVNKSSRRLSFILEKVITAIEKVEAFCSKSLLMIDEKLEHKAG
jgi:hypothetical protein